VCLAWHRQAGKTPCCAVAMQCSCNVAVSSDAWQIQAKHTHLYIMPFTEFGGETLAASHSCWNRCWSLLPSAATLSRRVVGLVLAAAGAGTASFTAWHSQCRLKTGIT
jgi:hypothetical protein